MPVTHYKQLTVWQKAMALVKDVYEITASFPKQEQFGLVSQLRRAAVSIPSNIAEGQGRMSSGEFIQFLGIARGSLHEVETQLIVACDLGFLKKADLERLGTSVQEVGRLLNGLIRSLKSKK